eukprot:5947428-Pleurochrysis_carterae.AAC.3
MPQRNRVRRTAPGASHATLCLCSVRHYHLQRIATALKKHNLRGQKCIKPRVSLLGDAECTIETKARATATARRVHG